MSIKTLCLIDPALALLKIAKHNPFGAKAQMFSVRTKQVLMPAPFRIDYSRYIESPSYTRIRARSVEAASFEAETA